MAHQGRHAGPARILLAAGLAWLTGCDVSDAPEDAAQHSRAAEIARIVPAEEAVADIGAGRLHPAAMSDAEIREVIGTGPRCVFRYTSSGKPVLAAGAPPNGPWLGAVVKLNGGLVRLEAVPAETAGGATGRLRLAAGPIRFALTPDPGDAADGDDGVRRRETEMVFEVGESLTIGYRGYLGCDMRPAIEAPAG